MVRGGRNVGGEKNKLIQCPRVTFSSLSLLSLRRDGQKNDYANEHEQETAWPVAMETGVSCRAPVVLGVMDEGEG
ncbi:hypothetical protein KOW79_007730 [Hemibagrus wyckioides]|uniref:Uncharacterized protein n=1 Tax=Hemibagrus wyckioides TaxID=337641 RepID=A0A9D3SLW8_9TELE|nr:hypothetical protein KOW79_007730 [Hemibagrus wyckioides]